MQRGETQPRGPLGNRFGPYELVRRLGEGGMGVVFEALDTRLGRSVALKMLLVDRKVSEQTVKRFDREARLVARLRHPNVCPVHETGEVDGRAYFTMELVRGKSLAGLIEDSGGGLPWVQAVALVRDAARGLAHAHESGVVHRDVKPSNILVSEASGHALVVDFGLATDDDALERLTKTGQLLGTPVYMAPERFDRHAKDLGESVDVYALGVTLYEALSGEAPYRGNNVLELVEKVKRGNAPPPRTGDDCPEDAKTVCLRAMAASPERRYPSAAAFADDLDRVLAGRPIAGRPVSFGEALRELARERPILIYAVAGSAIVCALSVASVAIGRARRHAPPVAVASPTPTPTSPPSGLATPGPPRTVDEALEQARSRLWTSDLEASKAAYDQAIALAPKNVDALLERALVRMLIQEPGASTDTQGAVLAHPDHPISLVLASVAAAMLGQKVPLVAERVIKKSPVGPMLRLVRSQAEDDLGERVVVLRQALAERPRCGLIAGELAQVLAAAGKPDEGLRILDEDRSWEGVGASLRAYARGTVLERAHRARDAEASYALVQGPPVIAVLARGRRCALAIERGDFAAAVAAHAGKEPGSLRDRVALARALVALHRNPQARAVLDAAVELSLQGSDNLGIYRAAGATEAELQAVALTSDLAGKTPAGRALAAAVRGRRARLAAREGDLATAQRDVEAISTDEGARERLATRGTIALVKGDPAGAERLFAQALETTDAVSSDALLDRALALEQTGDVLGAIAACKAALAADPTLKPAATAQLARLERDRVSGGVAVAQDEVLLDLGPSDTRMTGGPEGKDRWLLTSLRWVENHDTEYGFAPVLEIPPRADGRVLEVTVQAEKAVGINLLRGVVATDDHEWWANGHDTVASVDADLAPVLRWKAKPGTYTLWIGRYLAIAEGPRPLKLERVRVVLRK